MNKANINQNRTEQAVNYTACCASVPSVCLAWATKKRHIAVDGKVLCEPNHKTSGYSHRNGQYNSISLSGLPTDRKIHDDQKYGHSDGIIDFAPLNKQSVKINTRSICAKCLSRYESLF
jgi:hypothetical protein